MGFFTKETNYQAIEEKTVFVKLVTKVINILQRITHKLKLDKLFENSIFAKPIIWLCLLMFAVPFVPTMITLGLLMMTLLSLLLKVVLAQEFSLNYFRTNLWVLVFLLCVVLFGLSSIATEGIKQIVLLTSAFVVSYFVVIHTVETKGQFRFLLYVFVIAGTLSAVYGIYQYVFGDVFTQSWIDAEMFEDIRMRVYSTFENPNVYGEYLILVIPVIIALFWTEKGWLRKLFLLGMLGITMLAAVLTFSRGCWLGIILEVGILLVIIDKRFILLGVILLMCAPLVLPKTIMNRFTSIGNLKDSSTSYRVNIWYGTVDMLKDYWPSGVGVGTASFNAVYPMYSYNAISTQHSHNLFLQLLSSYGVIGFACFLIMMYEFFKEITIHQLKKKNIVVASLGAGMLGFLLESMFDYTWYNYRVLLIFWVYLALGMVGTKLERKEENDQDTKCH